MPKWIIDPDHSVAAFVVRHMMVANVRGQFNKIGGTVYFDPDNIAGSSVEAVIDVSGIYTGIQKRDDHLRSSDFFDAEKFPRMVFKSIKVEVFNEKRFKVIGDLTIRGITRTVDLAAEYSGPEKSPFGETSIGYSATTLINREDFGLMWNVILESGGVMAGKDVLIILDIEADRSND